MGIWKVRDSRGFSLVEMMVIGAVGSILMAAMLSMMNMANKSNRTIASVDEKNNLLFLTRMVLQAPNGCTTNLPGSFDGVNPINLTSLKFPAGGTLVAVPGDYGKLKVETATVKPAGGFTTLPSGDKVYFTNLIMKIRKAADSDQTIFGAKVTEESLPLALTTTAGNAITGCISGDISPAAVCTAVGGTFDNATQKCNVAPAIASVGCSAGLALQGFGPTGSPICVSIVSSVPTSTTPSPTPPTIASCAGSVCSGTNSIVFPVYGTHADGSPACNKLPYFCEGNWNMDSTKFTSACNSGAWQTVVNCKDPAGNSIPGCPLLEHPNFPGVPCG